MQKKHVYYYDLIKVIAAFMVCFYHLGVLDVGTVQDAFYIPNFNKLTLNLCAMSVPLFFMVNGALMLRRTYSIKKLIFRTVKIIVLYLVWVVILGKIGKIFFGIEELTIMEVAKGHRTTMSVHLWFLRTIAILTMMVPFLKWIYDRPSKGMLYILLVLMFIFPFLYNYFVLGIKWLSISGSSNLSVTGIFTMYSVLYFILGKIISDKSTRECETGKNHLGLAIIAIIVGWLLVGIEVTLWSNLNGAVYDGVNSSFPTIGALLMAVGTFYILSKLPNELNQKWLNILKIFADNIMGVYIFHTVLVSVVLGVVEHTVSVFGAAFLTVLIMLITTLITMGLKQIPLIKKLLTI